MNIEKKAERLSSRNWAAIRNKWPEFLPVFGPPGTAPPVALSDFHGLPAFLSQVSETGEARDEITGFRQEVFREAVYLLHKAAHVVGAAQRQVQSGLLTWALSDAYQGAFFGIKALFGLLGVSFLTVNGRNFLVDVWPGPQKGARQKKRKSWPDLLGTEMQIMRLPQMQHREFWVLFLRLINVTEVETYLWDPATIECLLALKEGDFALQRNRIHYRNNYWPMSDLHTYVVGTDFGKLNLRRTPRLDANQKDFTCRLSYIVLNLTYSLLNDLAQTAAGLSPEVGILRTSLNRDCHELYRGAYPI